MSIVADYPDTAPAQPGAAALIMRRIVAHVMGHAIRFDAALGGRTVEIQHEGTNGVLSPKLEILGVMTEGIP